MCVCVCLPLCMRVYVCTCLCECLFTLVGRVRLEKIKTRYGFFKKKPTKIKIFLYLGESTSKDLCMVLRDTGNIG